MLTTVIENLDKGGQGDFAGTGTTATPGSIATGTATPADTVKPQTPFETPKAPKSIPGAPIPGPGGIDLRASNFQTPTTTYATGPMGDGTPNATYASWYRNTYLRQSPPQNTGFDTFGERALSGASLGGITLKSPFLGGKSNPVTSPFGLCPGHSNPIHAGLDLGCAMGDPLTPMAPCQVIYAGPASGYGFVFDCRIMNGSTPSNVVFSYGHLTINSGITQGMIVNPGQVIGTCNTHGFSTGPHLHLEIVVDSPDIPKLYPGNGALSCHSSSRPVGHVAAASSQFGRNAYYVNPEPLLAGAVSLQGVEAAGFSAVATNFKNFGILDVGFLLVVVICIVSLQISKQAQRFTSGQGMGVFMKALGQMITGVIQTLGAMVGVGAKAAEMAAPVAGWAGGMAAGAAGQVMQRTGFDKVVNRAAEGVQGAMNNVTQGLSGVMDNIGSGISGFVGQSVQAVQTLPITQRVMEFQQGMRDLAAGIASSDFAQGIARVVMPGVAVLTFATTNIAMPVAGFVGRQMLLPAAGAAVQQGAAFAFNTLTDDMFKDVNFAGELQNLREATAKAPLSEAPARDAATRATPAVEQQEGLILVRKASADLNRTAEGTSSPDQGDSNTTGERQATNNYQRLGLEEGATFDQVKEAYRDLAKQYHPDGNRNQTEQEKRGFQEITAAYNVLKNDRMGLSRDDVQGTPSQGPTSDTPRQLSGTTVAPIPRGQTEDSRAAEDVTPQPRQSVERGYQGPDSSTFEFEGESSESEDTRNDTPSAGQDNSTNRGAVKDTRAEKERERIQEAKESEAKKAAEEREKALQVKKEEDEERKAQKEKQEKELRAKREKEAKAKKEKEQQVELARRIEEVKDKENRAVLNRRIEELRKEELRKKEQNLTPTSPKSRR